MNYALKNEMVQWKSRSPSIRRGQTANSCCPKAFPAGHPTSFQRNLRDSFEDFDKAFRKSWNTCKISIIKSSSTLWIKWLAKPREKNISSKGISERTKSYLGCPLCSFFCSSQDLSFIRLFKVRAPVNRKFFCRFWVISFSTIIYSLIHLKVYNTE